jgi:hypothetical protein
MKKLVVALGVIIITLFGVLFFYNPTHPFPISSDGHVVVTSLHANDLVTSPVSIIGTVTGGGWFFEASFPVKVLDGNGVVIGSGHAQAQADWMVTSSVPFTAIINFTAHQYATGSILLSKDNPSGMAKNDLSFNIPIKFK